MAAVADVAPYGADLIGPAFFPRLRRELHDFARFAGFSTTDSIKLALMGRWPGLRSFAPLGLNAAALVHHWAFLVRNLG